MIRRLLAAVVVLSMTHGISRGDTTTWLRLHELLALSSSDPNSAVEIRWPTEKLSTGEHERKTLVLPGVGFARLLDASEVRIPAADQKAATLEIPDGRILLDIDGSELTLHNQGEFRLATSKGLMATTGGKFFAISAPSGDDIFGVLTGAIQVYDIAKKTTINVLPGYAVHVRGQQVSRPIQLTETEQSYASQFYDIKNSRKALGLAKLKDFHSDGNGVTYKSKDKRFVLFQNGLNKVTPDLPQGKPALLLDPANPPLASSDEVQFGTDGIMHLTWRAVTNGFTFCGLKLESFTQTDLDKAVAIQFSMRTRGVASVDLDLNAWIFSVPLVPDSEWRTYLVPFDGSNVGKKSPFPNFNMAAVPLGGGGYPRIWELHVKFKPTHENGTDKDPIAMDVAHFSLVMKGT